MRKFLLTIAVTVVLALAFNKACADPVFNISGTALFNKTNYIQGSKQVATTTTFSFNNKTIYSIISNAVANGTNYDTHIMVTNLPANGYIAYGFFVTNNANNFSPYDSIFYPQVMGAFYVTNKTGFYYPLSGLDTNGNYYSFMELDTYDAEYGQLGFGNDFDADFSYSVNNGNGSETDTDTALLYINDDPVLFDDADFPDSYYHNNNSIEIRGILKLSLSVKNLLISKGAASLSGTGNAESSSQGEGMVTSGTMRLQ
jgi:hypothetical protein